MYHVYDGFIFPSEKWWNKISEFFVSTGINSKESYRFALTIYLESIKLMMTRPINHVINNISKSVCGIYLELKQKKFLQFDDINKVAQLPCADDLNKALQKVSSKLL